MKRLAAVVVLLAIGIAGWARYQASLPSPEVSLSRLMPQGALLFIESKDFDGLLHDWTSSPEKQSWLKSDNYEVFSRSRLFLRLQAAQQEFAAAAGAPPTTKFLSEVSGKRTALGIYDIGKLEMLEITEMSSSQAMQSAIWQQRSKFDPREASGAQFFVRTDPQTGRTFAFAVDGDYLILGTREDLVAGALSALKGGQVTNLDHEPWFVEAVRAAKQPGDLRMVIHLEDVAKTPHFRTYWIQQNITAMHSYQSAVADLYRSVDEYREERVLLRKSSGDSDSNNSTTAELAQLIPQDAGYYSSQSDPSPDEVVATIEQKILTPKTGPVPPSQVAPSVSLGNGTTGSDASLEERIDIPPALPQTVTTGDEVLSNLVKDNPPVAMLKVHRSQVAINGVFVRLSSAIILSSSSDWDESIVRSTIQQLVSPVTTTGVLGTTWRNVGTGDRAHDEFDGLLPVSMAVRGKYLLLSNDSDLLDSVLTRMRQKPAPAPPAAYIAAFNHRRERENFYHFATLVDQPNRNSQAGEHTPEFFSENLASLSRSLALNLASESIEIHRNGNIETQTVHYEWSH